MEKGTLTEYLKNIMVLETKVREIEQERDDINKAKNSDLKDITVWAGNLSEPQKPSIPKPDYRPETDYEIKRWLDAKGWNDNINISWIALFGVSAIFIIVALVGSLPILGRVKLKKSNREFVLREIRKENDEKRSEYDKKVREAEERYDKEKRIYDSKVQNIKKREEEAEIHNKNAAIAREELKPVISELNKNLTEVKNKLQEYYGLDIIFGKYRGLVPVSMMYEYLASSRCSSLEGPDGAYNLYETEIRQNIIIVQLQTIISQLESIKQNQYCLYQQLKEIEGNTKEMSNSLNKISSDVDRIKDISSYSASVQTQTMYMTANIEKQLDNIHGLQVASFFLK